MFLLSFRATGVIRPLVGYKVKFFGGKIMRYVGKYISKHVSQRLPEDKGARLVRYSKGTNRVSTRFAWNSTGTFMWRAKLGTFCRMFGLNSDNYKTFPAEWFGCNWVYHLRLLINAIKLPEFYPVRESAESLAAVGLTTRNQGQRQHGSCRGDTGTLT